MTRRFLLPSIVLLIAACSPPSTEQFAELSEDGAHHTFVLVHGVTGGGWDWRTVDELLSEQGHTVYRATLTGLGERVHLSNPDIDLTTHINDVANTILFEDLSDVVLVGHSYGGMVITGVMDLIPDRLKHVVFLDAGVPSDGMSAAELWGADFLAYDVVDGNVHFSWLQADAPIPKDVPHPRKTLIEPVSFKNPDALALPTTSIVYFQSDDELNDKRKKLSWRNAEDRGWTILTLESDHNAQRSHPHELVDLLEQRANSQE